MNTWFEAGALAAATLVSEDATAIGAAALAAGGHLDARVATLAVAVGIYAGDLLLFAAGRAAQRSVHARKWITRWRSMEDLRTIGARLDSRLGALVVGSRFVPGSRLALYVAAGACSQRPLAFCLWTLLAVLTWTPLLMGIVMAAGAVVEGPLRGYFAWAPAVGMLVAWRLLARISRKGASGARA